MDLIKYYPMRRKGIISLIITVLLLVAGYFFVKPAFNYISGYLSKSEPAKADILLVEGWLTDYSLKMAYDEFQKNEYKHIITTGINSFTSYYNVYGNGNLIFYTEDMFPGPIDGGSHSIEIDAYSSLEGENKAHFNVFINDTLAGDFFAEKQIKMYKVNWSKSLSDIDSITIRFTNDGMGDYGDRNLFIRGLRIDNKLTIPYLHNTVYELSKAYGRGRIVNNEISSADIARERLIALGIDSSLITAVPARVVRVNRTLTSALAFRDWLTTNNSNFQGINIISVGAHSRRTWMTYNKILNEKYIIGIISLPDNRSRNSPARKVFQTIRETFGIMYYWIILLPY